MHYLYEVKNDKKLFELFAAAVLFKINHIHSVVGRIDNKVIRTELHCKHNVAQRILDGMKDSSFFVVNPKNKKVFIPSFKSLEVRTFGRKNKHFKSNSDYCVKIEKKRYTLREIKRVLRESLLENSIHTKQRKQVKRFGVLDKNMLSCVTVAKEYVLTLKDLSDSFGLSKSSASRYITRLGNDNKVSKTLIVAERVVPVLNDITAREWMERNPGRTLHAWHCRYGWSGWLCYGRIYDIVDRRVSESFKHVIWNHKERISNIVSKLGQTPDGEKYWAKMS